MRWSLRGLLVVVVVVVGLWGWAEGRQWLLRVRAERLLADVRALQVNKGGWEDLERFRARWGRWGDYSGSCDREYCMYNVGLVSYPIAPWPPYGRVLTPKVEKVLDAVGLRFGEGGANVVMRRGVIVAKAFELDVAPPLAMTNTNFMTLSGEGPSVYSSSRDRALHPNHGLYLTNRGHLFVSFTPDEDVQEQAKLMDFRLDCLTVIRPCADRERILPAAVEEFKSEPVNGHLDQPQRCDWPFWADARDELVVAVGDVVAAKLDGEEVVAGYPPQWFVTVRIRSLMKGKLVRPVEKPFEITLFDERIMPGKGNAFPYRSLIIAGKSVGDKWMPPIEPDVCGAVEATAENLAEARRGIMKDFSPEALLER